MSRLHSVHAMALLVALASLACNGGRDTTEKSVPGGAGTGGTSGAGAAAAGAGGNAGTPNGGAAGSAGGNAGVAGVAGSAAGGNAGAAGGAGSAAGGYAGAAGAPATKGNAGAAGASGGAVAPNDTPFFTRTLAAKKAGPLGCAVASGTDGGVTFAGKAGPNPLSFGPDTVSVVGGFLGRVDRFGEPSWLRPLGSCRVDQLAPAPLGGTYALIRLEGSIDVGLGTIVSLPPTGYWADWVLIRFDASGKAMWQTLLPAESSTWQPRLAPHPDGGALLALVGGEKTTQRVRRVSPDGTILWEQKIPSSFWIGALLARGNRVAVVGTAKLKLTIPELPSYANGPGDNGLVLDLDADSGVPIAAHGVGDTTSWLDFLSASFEPDGSILAGGWYWDAPGLPHAETAFPMWTKILPSGETAWIRHFPIFPGTVKQPHAGYVLGTAVDVEGNGHILVEVTGSFDVGLGPFDSKTGYGDLVLLDLSKDGMPVRQRHLVSGVVYRTTTYGTAVQIQADDDGLAVAGSYEGGIGQGLGAPNPPLPGVHDYGTFVARLENQPE